MTKTDNPSETASEDEADGEEVRTGLPAMLWVPLVVALIAAILAVFGR